MITPETTPTSIPTNSATAPETIKKPPFFFSPFIYVESRSIKTWADRDTGLYEKTFYLAVGNDEPTGKNLKRVQVRLFGYELPTQAVLLGKGSDVEIELRHGELALFKIGRVVSKNWEGNHKGSITLTDKELDMYRQNLNLGAEVFEIWSPEQKRLMGLNGAIVPEREPPVWPLGALISADDTKSVQVELKIDFGNKQLVSIFADGPAEKK